MEWYFSGKKVNGLFLRFSTEMDGIWQIGVNYRFQYIGQQNMTKQFSIGIKLLPNKKYRIDLCQ